MCVTTFASRTLPAAQRGADNANQPNNTQRRAFPPRAAYEQLLFSRENSGSGSGPDNKTKTVKRAPTFDPGVLQRAYERVRRREEVEGGRVD